MLPAMGKTVSYRNIDGLISISLGPEVSTKLILLVETTGNPSVSGAGRSSAGSMLVSGDKVEAVTVLRDADVDASLLYVLAITSIGVYGVLVAGWASNSKYSFGLRKFNSVPVRAA